MLGFPEFVIYQLFLTNELSFSIIWSNGAKDGDWQIQVTLMLFVGWSFWDCYEIDSYHHPPGPCLYPLCHFHVAHQCAHLRFYIMVTCLFLFSWNQLALLSSDCPCSGLLWSSCRPCNLITKHCASPVVSIAVADPPPHSVPPPLSWKREISSKVPGQQL